ncbi:hypothetical protein LINPERHAP1_LOCUS22425 [Linum perenne]
METYSFRDEWRFVRQEFITLSLEAGFLSSVILRSF